MQNFEIQAQAFAERIQEELAEGRLNFPTVLDVSIRIKKLADDPDSTLDQIASVVKAEPVLSAKVVRMANAVAMNPYSVPVTSVNDAVRRVGLSALRCLAFAVAAEQLAQDHRSKSMRLIASGLWMHTVEVAAWAYALARKLRVVNPDQALFAGMMVDIGQFFLLARASAFPALEQNLPLFGEFVMKWNEQVSRAILEIFELPEEILDALQNEQAYGGHWPPAVLSEILHLARIACKSANPFSEMSSAQADASLASGESSIAPETIEELLESVKTERDQILAAICA